MTLQGDQKIPPHRLDLVFNLTRMVKKTLKFGIRAAYIVISVVITYSMILQVGKN